MQYAQTFALVSAALATLAAAQPHVHQHAHLHHAREAEPVAEAEAEAQNFGNRPTAWTTLQMSDVVVTHTQTQTAGQQQQTVTAAAQTTPAAHKASAKQTTVATSVRQSAAASSAHSSAKASSSSTIPSSNGSPTVKIINQCDNDIWIGEGNNDMQSLAAGASPFQTPLAGTSISWKMGFASNASWTGENAEIEFTVTGSNNMTYDLSLQKGNPFVKYGQKLELSDSSCQPIHCLPNQTPCPNAYNTEEDNSKVGQPSLPCSKASIVFTACSG